MKLHRYRYVIGLSLAVLAASPAWADVIAEWDIAGSRGHRADVLYAAEGVSAGRLETHGVTAWNPGWNYRGFVGATHWNKNDQANPDKYFQFEITAPDETAITYESISFSLFRGDYSRGRHGAEKWYLAASPDGFSEHSMNLARMDISDSGADEQILFSDLDISAVGTVEGTVSFRLYGAADNYNRDYSGLGNVANGRYGFGPTGSNLIIEGQLGEPMQAMRMDVPEPTTLLVICCGGMAALMRRRTA
jgi:hypothetical protein